MPKQRVCPFCGKELNQYDGKHIYTCKHRDINLSKEQLRLKYLQFNYGEYILDDICNDYENLYSLPMLKEKYDDIDYNSIKFLLKLRNIKQRIISESAQKISQEKIKQTCIEKYGVENVSQLKEIKQKKEQTFTNHYGVDNIWKLQGYNKKCAELHPESHEEHMRKLHQGCQKFWDNLTEDGLKEWIEKVQMED